MSVFWLVPMYVLLAITFFFLWQGRKNMKAAHKDIEEAKRIAAEIVQRLEDKDRS